MTDTTQLFFSQALRAQLSEDHANQKKGPDRSRGQLHEGEISPSLLTVPLPGQYVVSPRPIATLFHNHVRDLGSAKPIELGWLAGPIINGPVENLVYHWIKHLGLGFQPCVPGPKRVVIFHHIHFTMCKTPITRIFHSRKALPG